MRFYQVLWQTDYCYRVCRCWKLKDDPPMHGPCVYLESGPARSLGQDGSFTHKGRAEEDHSSTYEGQLNLSTTVVL